MLINSLFRWTSQHTFTHLPGFIVRQTNAPIKHGIKFDIMINDKLTTLILPLDLGSKDAVPKTKKNMYYLR